VALDEAHPLLADLAWNAASLRVGTVKPKGIAEVDRIAVRKAIKVQPARQPNRIFVGKAPLFTCPGARPRPIGALAQLPEPGAGPYLGKRGIRFPAGELAACLEARLRASYW